MAKATAFTQGMKCAGLTVLGRGQWLKCHGEAWLEQSKYALKQLVVKISLVESLWTFLFLCF